MKSKNVSLLISLLLLAASGLLITSCSTSSLMMEVLIPGDISVPAKIKNIGIVNRSLPSSEREFANIVEGFFTGESIHADREGSDNCVRGLANGLNESPRFNALVLEGLNYRGTGTRQFPPTLAWADVGDLCNRFRVDAIVALETFDSDIGLREGSREVEKKVNDVKVKVKEYFAELNINVNSGWRIYYPAERMIVDQNVYTDHMSWSGEGSTPQNALSKLPSKRYSINQSAIYSGNKYAHRISPSWMNVSRSYYVKGVNDFEQAKRYVKTDDWDKAVAIWKPLVQDTDPKIAGRAAYNMALASEMKGELEIAISWAKKAYEQFGNKKALSYKRSLESRLHDQELLQQQMGGGNQ